MSADPTSQPGNAAPPIVVMGVSGCGKTTVGVVIAERLGLPFGDADEFHPQANIDKMAGGTPLTDEDRWPWLEAIGQWLTEQTGGAVVTCSALRTVYRDRIRTYCPDAYFVHLDGPMEVAYERVSARKDHFMPAELMQSQYDTLEALSADESGVVINFDQPVDAIVEQSMEAIDALRGAAR